MFTLAHTAAVAGVATGFTLPASDVIEPLIAASIAVAGWGAYRQIPMLHAGPWVLGFGFVHGLGFAEGLSRLEPTFSQLFVSVLAFNLGVEAAQVLAVLVVLGLLHAATRLGFDAERLVRSCALGVTAIGVAWTVLRLTLLFG